MIAIVLLLGLLLASRIATLGLVRGQLVFNIIASALVWTLIAFRSVDFGADTVGYVRRFTVLAELSWSETVQRVFSEGEKDPFFYLFARLVAEVGLGPRGWLQVLAAVFCGALGYAVHKYSPAPLLSYIMAVSLGYVGFAMTGLRQTLALAILLLSWSAIRERKPLRFLLIVLAASALHSSALAFVLAYPAAKLKVGRHWLLLAALGTILVVALPGVADRLIAQFAWTDALAGYAGHEQVLTYTGFAIYSLLLVGCVVAGAGVLARDPKAAAFYGSLSLAVILHAGAASQIAELFRIGMYFGVVVIWLLPMAVMYGVPVRSQRFVHFAACCVFLGYMLVSGTFVGYSIAV